MISIIYELLLKKIFIEIKFLKYKKIESRKRGKKFNVGNVYD